MNITETVRQDIITKVQDRGLTAENIAIYLYAMGEFNTKAEARKAVDEVLKESDLVPMKKQSMADQLKEWFHAQPAPLEVTKEELKKQIEVIGMSGGSVNWYIRVYQEAQSITTRLIEEAK